MEYNEKVKSKRGISKWFHNTVGKINDISAYAILTLFVLPVYIYERVYDAYDGGRIFSPLENRILLDRILSKI